MKTGTVATGILLLLIGYWVFWNSLNGNLPAVILGKAQLKPIKDTGFAQQTGGQLSNIQAQSANVGLQSFIPYVGQTH